MRNFLILLLASGFASAQSSSNPTWWSYASPDSSALIGIQWTHIKGSPLEAPLAKELSPKGWLGMPDLTFLSERADRVLIASPYLMAIEFGSFPKDVVRAEAASKGLKESSYKNVELWITAAPESMSLAWISEQIVILGHLPTLKESIDRNFDTEGRRAFSPLFARAAQHSTKDLWVVSGALPDLIVGRFVPLKVPAVAFEGDIELTDGLKLSATLATASEQAAEKSVDAVWKSIEPKWFEYIRMFTDSQLILITMELNPEQLLAATAPPPAPVVAVAEPKKASRPSGPRVVKITVVGGEQMELPVSERAK